MGPIDLLAPQLFWLTIGKKRKCHNTDHLISYRLTFDSFKIGPVSSSKSFLRWCTAVTYTELNIFYAYFYTSHQHVRKLKAQANLRIWNSQSLICILVTFPQEWKEFLSCHFKDEKNKIMPVARALCYVDMEACNILVSGGRQYCYIDRPNLL